MAGFVGKVEKEIEIKTPAEKFYNILKGQCHHIPNLTTDKIHTIDVHEGDWETPGSVKLWKYNIGGKVETFKEKVDVDDENKAVIFTAVGGHVLDHFKSYKGTFKVTPKADSNQGGLVKLTLDYEKRDVNDHDPIDDYMDFLVKLVEDIDTQLPAKLDLII
ncbi:MLP-like protein 34 [Cannabis sativa]|uniref:MLP-like protein 34 n=1 Tax=Cannabis sativa TaxID=3483 RepID=UPI0029CA3165|nr:MLP-like protein 34 [Cannabis sativa]